MERITYMNKQLWPKRNKRGEYTHKGVSFMPYISGAAIIVFGLFLFMNGSLSVEYHATSVEDAAVLDDGKEPLTQEDIEAKKDAVVKTILNCERAGHSEDDAIIIYDNNKAGTLTGKNVWSLGQLQFKVSTIQGYVKMRDGVKITQKEAVLLAFDTARASELAKWIIFEADGWSNWKNCSVKYGIPAKVKEVKALKVGDIKK